jgi:putative membrane protein
MSTQKNDVLAQAEFDPRLPNSFMMQTVLFLLTGFFTIPLIPIWFIVGRSIHKRQYESLACQLTPRNLNVRSGLLFKIQKSIPLDKITDLAVNEGPILRYLACAACKSKPQAVAKEQAWDKRPYRGWLTQ